MAWATLRKVLDVLKDLRGLVPLGEDGKPNVPPELDLSDQIIIECTSIYEANRLKYIPWEACTIAAPHQGGIRSGATKLHDATAKSSSTLNSKHPPLPVYQHSPLHHGTNYCNRP